MQRFMKLSSLPFKGIQNFNMRLVQAFSATEEPKQQQQPQQQEQEQQQKYQNRNGDKKRYSNDNRDKKQPFQMPEKSIEEYCKELLENKSKRLIELTNRKELDIYRKISNQQKYDYYNFVLAKCYINNMKYFSQFFNENHFNHLLNNYTLQNFDKFFNNFVLASVILVNFEDKENIYAYNRLIQIYVAKTDKLKEMSEEQSIIFKMSLALRFIPTGEIGNEPYKNFISKFIPEYFDTILQNLKFFDKTTYTEQETQFISYYFLLKVNSDLDGGIQFLNNIYSKYYSEDSQQLSVDSASAFIKSFVILLNQNEEVVIKNFQIFSPILEKSLIALRDQQPDIKEVVTLYYVISRTQLNTQNKESTIKLLQQLESYLPVDKFQNLHQKKSLFYSIGKNSYLSEKITNYLKQNLTQESLKIYISKDKFEQYLGNLLLCSVNLGVLTKENIQKDLIEIIIQGFNKIQNNAQVKQKFLTTVAISLYRAYCFPIEFWKLFLENVDIKMESHLLNFIMKTFYLMQSEMSQELAVLFESKCNEYKEIHKDKQIQADNNTPTIDHANLQAYFDANSISYKKAIYNDAIFCDFIVNEKDVVLIMNMNNHIIQENSDCSKLNVSNQFKVDLLKKRGFNVIIINTFEEDLVQQYKQKSRI